MPIAYCPLPKFACLGGLRGQAAFWDPEAGVTSHESPDRAIPMEQLLKSTRIHGQSKGKNIAKIYKTKYI